MVSNGGMSLRTVNANALANMDGVYQGWQMTFLNSTDQRIKLYFFVPNCTKKNKKLYKKWKKKYIRI